MCSRSATRTVGALTLLGAMLGGCSEYYFDRRDGVSLHSGDSVATNRVAQMIDPWPAASGRRTIAYNGEKAAVAAERYRTGRVITPISATTSSSNYTPAPPLASNTPTSSTPNAGSNSSNNPTK